MGLCTESTRRLTWNYEEEQPASRQTGAKFKKLHGDTAAVDKICLAFMSRFGHKAVHLVYAEKRMIYRSISYLYQ